MNPTPRELRSQKIDPRYANTSFATPHEDGSGNATRYFTTENGCFIFVTPNERREYEMYGKFLERALP